MPTASPSLTVYRIGNDIPVRFAAKELARYLRKMTGGSVAVRAAKCYDPDALGCWVGLGGAFGKSVPPKKRKSTHPFDDAVFVKASAGHAIVSGANPRSVLFAVYRYLEELGCCWMRPGRDGERVPAVKLPLASEVKVSEVPSYRHRCICIEGSCGIEHVRDMIAYSAKRGFNAYFIQFRDAYTFWDKWYRKECGETFSPRDARAHTEAAKAEAVKRGLILHTVGHGWTCEPFGIAGREWSPTRQPVSDETRASFAEINGERALWRGIPLNTQLCYGNPKVREILTNAVVDYAEEHPDEDIVHVWLADGSNNFCECKLCKKHRPSDLYVRMLNRIDEMLTDRNLPTKIIFLAYVDLLWAPKRERLTNPERFILMFAPITRSYSRSFLDRDTSPDEDPGPYRRNKLTFPASPKTNLKMLDDWRTGFDGDCVDFDYHLWSGYIFDPGQMHLAEVIFRDLRDLHKLKMQGFISCQMQRISFPTGLYMETMGRMLWNRKTKWQTILTDHFTALYGKEGATVCAYLEELDHLFEPPFLRGEVKGKEAKKEAIEKLASIPEFLADFAPTIAMGKKDVDKTTRAAWLTLEQHAWYAEGMARCWLAITKEDRREARRAVKELREGFVARLSKIHHVADLIHVFNNLDMRVKQIGKEPLSWW